MPKVTYIEHNNFEHNVDARPGSSVMEVAKVNGIPGIDADCGGVCSCATCHVYVDANWINKVGNRSESEAELLELVANPDETSRLSCQIIMSDDLDGLIVRIPESQY